MPSSYCGSNNHAAIRKLAEKQVKEKFPDLQRESSGWYRAVDNRYRRLLK